MTTARHLAVAGAVGGIVYVIGGGHCQAREYLATVEAYDPASNLWTTRSPMPTPRLDMTATVLDGRIYVMGGIDASETPLATVECYDPVTDQWTRRASLPNPYVAPFATVVNDRIHVFHAKDHVAYDPRTNRWTRLPSLPAAAINYPQAAGGVIDGRIYLVGGFLPDSSCAHQRAIAYLPVTDQLSERRMIPVPCVATASAAIDGKLYVAGGMSGAPTVCPNSVYYDNTWMFDPQGGVSPHLLQVAREPGDTVRLVWQGEAGRRYRVETSANVASGPWTPWGLSSGSSIVATNALINTTGTAPAAGSARFFRVREAD